MRLYKWVRIQTKEGFLHSIITLKSTHLQWHFNGCRDYCSDMTHQPLIVSPPSASLLSPCCPAPQTPPQPCLHNSYFPQRQSLSLVCVHTHTHNNTHTNRHTQVQAMFPELIGVTLAWQEAQCHYANDQSITGQRVNTLSVIFDAHICTLLMAVMPACYLGRRIISAFLGGQTAIYLAGVNCVIVGLPRIRATGWANRDI